MPMPTVKNPLKAYRKFADFVASLEAAANGEIDLRDNYKLYNKVYRFYKKEGVTFTGDASIDYNMVVNYIYEDLYTNY